jgi:hypothetical protein
MKRAISLIILASLLSAAVQPSIAVHYCKGELRSVSFVKKDLPKQCCEKNRPGCCTDRFFKIQTDSFSVHRTDTDIQSPVFLHPVLCAVNGDLIFPPENYLLIQQIFPPGGLARYGAELRHLFCIYRI